jgi:hypothetical protein
VATFYDPDSATAMLPRVRPIAEALRDQRAEVARLTERIRAAEVDDGTDPAVAAVLRARVRATVDQMEAAVARLDAWGIVLRDIRTGLLDFPALADGRPVWLCWRLGEDEVAWWHEATTGFEGRQPASTLERSRQLH